MDDAWASLCGIVLGIVGVLVGLIVGIQWLSITFFDNIPSKVYVDGGLVYEGTSAGFSTESNGYATKVVIQGGFMYFFPQEVYVSKDVVIEGKKVS